MFEKAQPPASGVKLFHDFEDFVPPTGMPQSLAGRGVVENGERVGGWTQCAPSSMVRLFVGGGLGWPESMDDVVWAEVSGEGRETRCPRRMVMAVVAGWKEGWS